MFHGGWQTEKNAKRYLQRRPSVEEIKVLLQPLCYRYTYQSLHAKPEIGGVPNFSLMRSKGIKRVDIEATKNAHEYEKQLSRQLLKELMTQRGITYDEKEAKMQSLYSIHGKYATFALLRIPELCTALKEDRPEWSNEHIKSKARLAQINGQ
jgi:hypothetical protein